LQVFLLDLQILRRRDHDSILYNDEIPTNDQNEALGEMLKPWLKTKLNER
ncbi:16393_t:CDS:1, partial [Gigaspora rosea]